MLDLNAIRQDPEAVAARLALRGVEADLPALLALDAERRSRLQRAEALKADRNQASQEIGRLRKAGEDAQAQRERVQAIGAEIKELDAAVAALDQRIHGLLAPLPNLPDPDVVAGDKEANEVVRTVGEAPDFDFEPRDHVDLARGLDLIDYERGVKLGGSGSWIYRGLGARLEWALLSYFVDAHQRDGYEFVLPPHILEDPCGYTAGQFPKFEDDVYHLRGDDQAVGRFLLPTAETALVNLYRDEVLAEAELPIRCFAYTPCYRREAGGYRSAERGTLRGHQFNKVEMFQFTTPEQSDAAFDELLGKAEALMQGLGLHYQVSKLAALDISASMARTYDVEVWIPSLGFKEVSSVSNARDYQARRGAIRYKRAADKKNTFVHTLNGSGLATSRLVPAILEQGQRADGSVALPEVLRPWLPVEALEP